MIDRPPEKIVGGKGLVPIPTANQSVERIKGNFLFLAEKRNGVSVEVSLDEQSDSLQLVIGVEIEHYLRDEIIQPKSFVVRRVVFEPLYFSTAKPMQVLLSVNDQLFMFQFQ